MPEEEAHLQKLIETKTRYLQKLQETHALKGIDTPPSTLLEIENTTAELTDLQAKLDALAPPASPTGQRVYLSATLRLLPDHLKQVQEACARQGMAAMLADPDSLPAEALRRLDQADFYLGVFAHRYGPELPASDLAGFLNLPGLSGLSLAELEYHHALERKLPRLIFLMSEEHPITGKDLEKDPTAQAKLNAMKQRLAAENACQNFASPAELRGQAINALAPLRHKDLTTLHYISDIPAPPQPYLAHPYTLLHTRDLVGRQTELNLLTDWVTSPHPQPLSQKGRGEIDSLPRSGGGPGWGSTLLCLTAIGGMGKSALAWKWFNDIAPQEMRPLAGRLWWSFYESDATFEAFVSRALAYVSRRPRQEIERLPLSEQSEQLLAALERDPYLLVLDGLERLLLAYARLDAARLADDDLDQQTANHVAGALGLPDSAAQSFIGQHRLRRTADPRAGHFLRRLADLRSGRVLLTSRLYPADLQTVTGGPLPGCAALFLPGLGDDDALNLWRAFAVSGSREALLPLFRTFGHYPLLIRALAGEVAGYRRAPGDFDRWRADHPHFDPFSQLSLAQTKTHVLAFALNGLSESERRLLETLAAFRMPATFDTLAALLLGEGKAFVNETALDAALAGLEDRGLVGWDRRANRYDLHPIVRGVTWSRLADPDKQALYNDLHSHFEAIPKIENWWQVNSLADLTPAIELYHTLIGLGRYDEAEQLFYDRLDRPTYFLLSVSRQRAELLEPLFPDGLEHLPRLGKPDNQAFTLNALAQAYQFSGRPGAATPLYRRHNTVCEQEDNKESLSIGLDNLSSALRLTGDLREAEAAARQALRLTHEQENRVQEAVSLEWLGLTLATRGLATDSRQALQRALQIDKTLDDLQGQGFDIAYLAQRALWLGNFTAARPLANRAWKLAQYQRYEKDCILTARLQGEAALGLGDWLTAEERLHHALTRARAVTSVEDELPALIALAQLRRAQAVETPRGASLPARELLDQVWEAAEIGPYPFFHADACNVLAQIERDEGNNQAAIAAATQAYRLAWGDGPPFAYHWGLQTARAHLLALATPEPVLPPFDESKFEPMPEVEIDPAEE